MAATLQRALEQHATHFASITATLGGVKDAKARDVQVLRDQLAALAAGVSSLQALQEKTARDTERKTEAALSGLATSVQTYASETASAADSAQAAAVAAVEALSASISAQAEALREAADAQRAEAQALQASLAAALQEAQARFARLGSGSARAAAGMQQVVSAASGSLADFASSFELGAKRKQEALMAQIGTMLAAFASEQAAAVAGAVDRAKSQLGAGGSAMVEALRGTTEAAEAAATDVQVRQQHSAPCTPCTPHACYVAWASVAFM